MWSKNLHASNYILWIVQKLKKHHLVPNLTFFFAGSFHRSVCVHPRRVDVWRPRRLLVHSLVGRRQLLLVQYNHSQVPDITTQSLITFDIHSHPLRIYKHSQVPHGTTYNLSPHLTSSPFFSFYNTIILRVGLFGGAAVVRFVHVSFFFTNDTTNLALYHIYYSKFGHGILRRKNMLFIAILKLSLLIFQLPGCCI